MNGHVSPGDASGAPSRAAFKPGVVHASALAAVDAFRQLSRDEVEAIARHCHGRFYGPRAEIIAHQDESTDVYFILSGKVQVTMYARSGRVVTFQDLGAGSMFGEVGALDGHGRTAGIVTVTDTHVARIPGRDFLELMWAYPSLGRTVVARLTDLVRFLCGRVVELHALPVPHRVRAELLRLASAEIPDGRRVVLRPAPTHADIANRAGTRREAVARELGALSRIGLVGRERRHAIVVNDIDRLRALVDDGWNEC